MSAELTPQELREAVCEMLGLTRESLGPDWNKLPELTLDLIHEAEATLTDDDWQEYYRRLYITTRPTPPYIQHPGCDQHTRNFIHASKEQRGKALVETLRTASTPEARP